MTELASPEEYVSAEHRDVVLDVASRMWRRRQGVERVVDFLASDHMLSRMVHEVDSLILGFSRLQGALHNQDCQNVRSLARVLKFRRQRLPLLLEPRPCDEAAKLAFARTLASMSPLMARAEAGKPEPKLTFAANSELTPEQAAVGGIIQFAGRHMARKLGISPEMPVLAQRGSGRSETIDVATLIMDALLEMSVRDPGSGDATIFGAALAMGWYGTPEKSYPFTPELSATANGMA